MISFLSWCWVGLIVGVSFIATPAKFLTTSSSLSQLLEIGRVTFSTFMFVEIALLIVLLLAVFKSENVSVVFNFLLSLLICIMLIQYAYLQPLLDDRVDTITQGMVLESSNTHWLYILAELSKLATLVIVGIQALQRTQKVETHATNST